MISVPVYSDENGTPHISIYVEDEDGSFRRTQSEPLRLLRDDIQGISISQGDMVSGVYDRHERHWHTPTVTFHYGRPQSFYQFLRDKVAHNRFFVFTKPQLAGHISKFSLHELKLKNSTSQRKVAILKEKYVEALQLWREDELEAKNAKAAKDKLANNTAIVHNFNRNQPVKVPANEKPAQPQIVAQPQRDNVRHFRRADVQEQNVREVIADSVAAPHTTEREFRSASKQRKNLIQDFSLSKPRKHAASQSKEHNKHFYKRFIFTIE
ncbi:hypothetical protein [Kaarinaea lacus]